MTVLANIFLLVLHGSIGSFAFRVETHSGAAVHIVPNVTAAIPGEEDNKIPIDWHIEHYIALLGNTKLFNDAVLSKKAHAMVHFTGDWPEHSPLYEEIWGDLGFKPTGSDYWEHLPTVYSSEPDRAFAHQFIARYTVVMRIVILQVLKGLLEGRLGEVMEKYLSDSGQQTRAYMVALLRKMNLVFGHVAFRLSSDNDSLFAFVCREENADPCPNDPTRSSSKKPYYEKLGDFYVVDLGQAFFKLAAHSLKEFEYSGSRVGTLLHEISHAVKDERLTMHKADGWDGDPPTEHRKYTGVDDGRLGTYDYAYMASIDALSARDKRHNADSVQYFIEMAVLKERKDGHAVSILADFLGSRDNGESGNGESGNGGDSGAPLGRHLHVVALLLSFLSLLHM